MRILDLTTDCLLLSVKDPKWLIKHCQSGPSVMHSGCPKRPPRFSQFKLLFELLRARRYDWVILPPVHVEWTVANGAWRKLIKGILGSMIRYPSIFRFGICLVFGRNSRFVITDYSDEFAPSRFALDCLRPEHYFMLNVPSSLVGKRIGPANTLVHYLPTVIQDDLIDTLSARFPAQRENDVFIAGTYHNSLRENQLEAVQILAERGCKVFELKERSFEKFSAGILNSKLCMAAKGLSYHCFRPLEAAAAGAAPIWHSSENDAYHDYVHGENCFLYDPILNPSQIADFVELVLKQPDQILQVVQGSRELLNTKHRASSLAGIILRVLE